jgi:hypothetical protein
MQLWRHRTQSQRQRRIEVEAARIVTDACRPNKPKTVPRKQKQPLTPLPPPPRRQESPPPSAQPPSIEEEDSDRTQTPK